MKADSLSGLIGRICELEVVRQSEHGVFLSLPCTNLSQASRRREQEIQCVLLPKKFGIFAHGSKIAVFLYTDSQDRLVATTQTPLLKFGEIGALEIVDVVANGYFVDLGIDKQLFVPAKNPKAQNLGSQIVVYVARDKQMRLIGKLAIRKYLQPCKQKALLYSCVKVLVFEKTPLGFGCVVEGRYYGLVYHSELAFSPSIGETLILKVTNLRKDGKLDLGPKREQSVKVLLEILQQHNGCLELDFKSESSEIFALTALSKKNFKILSNKLVKENLAYFADKNNGRKNLCLRESTSS